MGLVNQVLYILTVVLCSEIILINGSAVYALKAGCRCIKTLALLIDD